LFTPEPPPRPRILLDYYHHLKPNTAVGEHLVTGGWASNVGRYGWDDFAHTNSFDPLFTGLEKEFALSIMESPFTPESLSQTEAVVIINPDSPELTPTVPVISDDEISALNRFVRSGGSLLVLINSGGHSTEKFEEKQLGKLLAGFGLSWNSDDTHYSGIHLGNQHPYFYDVPVFHYGAGCTLNILSHAEDPAILMQVASDPSYPERDVEGPGIVMVRPGAGKVIVVGDTGSWGANISRPWAENRRVMRQLFRYLKPSTGVVPPQYVPGMEWNYDFTVAGLSAIPRKNSVGELERPYHRNFSPRPKTNIPYLEASGTLSLRCDEVSPGGVASLAGHLESFQWFEDPVALEPENETFAILASRQGNLANIEANGRLAEWLAADIGMLVALLPVDGLRVGDRWDSIERIRIPSLQGSDVPVTKPVEAETVYLRDETIHGRACRVLQVSFEVWLNEIGVSIEDVLPPEEVRRWGGPRFDFLEPRGGTLLIKREQWVDQASGLVVKARSQSRIVAWIHDLRKAVGPSPEDKDQNMVTAFAHIVTLERK
jgi:hypothetical protein